MPPIKGTVEWEAWRLKIMAIKRSKTKPIIERIMARVEKTDTYWLWRGAVGMAGYGIVTDRTKTPYTRSVHRVVYEELVGAIPPSLQVCHRCDVRICVNPDHFFIGTASDNHRDAWLKGRKSNPALLPSSREKISIKIKEQFRTGRRVVLHKANGDLAGTRVVKHDG